MRTFKNILIGFAAILLLLILFLSWYTYEYSMEIAPTYEVNSFTEPQRVLIATQGSEYKNKVVEGVVAYLENKPVFIRVTDISNLQGVHAAEWDAIVVLHTWEIDPPKTAHRFILDNYPKLEKIVVVSTSGNGGRKIKNVDAITGASEMDDVPVHIKEINQRLDAILSHSGQF